LTLKPSQQSLVQSSDRIIPTPLIISLSMSFEIKKVLFSAFRLLDTLRVARVIEGGGLFRRTRLTGSFRDTLYQSQHRASILLNR
jgi:hypothetical protein